MKYLPFIIIAQGFIPIVLTGCPYEFSPQDARPFFEQYKNQTTSQSINEKEKNHEKNINSHAQPFNDTANCKS